VSWSWARLAPEGAKTAAVGPAPVAGRVEELGSHHDEVPELACRCCGASPRPTGLGGFDLLGWRCDACLKAARLLFMADGRGRGAPADEAELVARG
jgi:hypothetical protein